MTNSFLASSSSAKLNPSVSATGILAEFFHRCFQAGTGVSFELADHLRRDRQSEQIERQGWESLPNRG
jgi:hypothetical protein